MTQSRIRISAAVAILGAFLYYIGDAVTIAGIILPVLWHELGHVCALRLLGLRIKGFRAELRGFCIEYAGYVGEAGHALAAAAGPVAGLLYAAAASRAAARWSSPWLEFTAGASLLLSVFNLLPALPLDGGRVALCLATALLGEERGERTARALGMVTGALLLLAGLWLWTRGMGLAVTIPALWILLYGNGGQGIVKHGELL